MRSFRMRAMALGLTVCRVLQVILPVQALASSAAQPPGEIAGVETVRVLAPLTASGGGTVSGAVYGGQAAGAVVVRYTGAAAPELVPLAPGADLDATLAALRADPAVAWAEPNYELRALVGPSAEFWGGTQRELIEVQATHAWQLGREVLATRGAGAAASPVTVAVVDTGVDAAHEDLSGRLLTGVNVVTGAADARSTVDDSVYGQGTLVAGVIAAGHNNAKGIDGAAGEFPVRVLPVKARNADGVGSAFDVAHGIREAADRGAHVINLSLGARLPAVPQVLAEAVQYARDRGAVVVAAAGDDGGTVAGLPGRGPRRGVGGDAPFRRGCQDQRGCLPGGVRAPGFFHAPG